MTFLLELRVAAMQCLDKLLAYQIRACADNLEFAIHSFARSPADEMLAEVNGLWARGHLLLSRTAPLPGDDGGGGRLREGARLAA